MSGVTEVAQGLRVSFLNGGPDLETGIVNGRPWVYFDGSGVVCMVPVHVTATNKNIAVAGANIMRVGEARNVVERIAGYSERV